ncbi:MAG: alkaline phosphatase family protein [Thermoanaerobaculia bacterium]
MKRHRLSSALLILLALAILSYLMISLYLPSSSRLILGVDKQTGAIRMASSNVTFLPPNRYYRMVFDLRNGTPQRDGVVVVRSSDGIPVKVAYRIRFSIDPRGLADPGRLVANGWSAWMRARVAEAVSAVTSQVPIEDLTSPMSTFSAERDRLRRVVADHLARSGLQVSAFEILRIDVDRDALLAFQRTQLRRKARGAFGRVAIFGIDGADWSLLHELIVDDHMPNLSAMIDGGAIASVTTIQPPVAPMLWSAVATGLPPGRNGVVDWMDRSPSGTQGPVNSQSRRAPALWEIASAFGRDVGVVDWWTDWPPAMNRGFVVSEPLNPEFLVYPPSLAKSAGHLRVPESTIDFGQVKNFLNINQNEFDDAISKNDPADPIIEFRRVLAKSWSDHRIAMSLYRREQPELLMFNFEGSDLVNHLFGPYHPPWRSGLDGTSFRRYWPAVVSYYSELDRMLGEWLKLLPQDTTVIVMSAHGMVWGDQRPLQPPKAGEALQEDDAPGVFIAFGNRVTHSPSRHEMTLYDVAPTVLALLGLPKAEEMPGEITGWALNGIEPVTAIRIVSYGDSVTTRPLTTSGSVSPAEYQRQLQLAGHVAPPNAPPSPVNLAATTTTAAPDNSPKWGEYAWNNDQGVKLFQQRKYKEASDAFEKAIELYPDRPAAYYNLTVALIERGAVSDADDVFLAAVKRGLPDPEQRFVDVAALYRSKNMVTRAIDLLQSAEELYPQSFLIASELGASLAAADRYTDAMPELQRALSLQPVSTDVLNNIGTVFLKRKDYSRALDYWNRSLSIDPRQPKIRAAAQAVSQQL